MASAKRGGSFDNKTPKRNTGIPKISRGIIFTGDRTDIEGVAPCS